MAAGRTGMVRVLGSSMFYREAGAGPAVLLLHGNPTSSYLWRHVLELVAGGDGAGHRWVAPDLIGMGGSGKPDIGYRLSDHIEYVDGFLAALGLTPAVLIGHDWGVAIALDRLRRHPAGVRGVAIMEGHLRPLAGWDEFDDGGRELFQRLRAPGIGERMVLAENFFLDTLLPAGLVREIPAEDMAVYRAPYPDPPSRRPLLQWAREIPVGGTPADVAQRMAAALDHLAAAQVPGLLVHHDPGVLVTADTVAWCRDRLTRLSAVDVGGPAGHFLPEDRPEQVAAALVGWVAQLTR